jgi:L-amino acid N-acyltransferase YncA
MQQHRAARVSAASTLVLRDATLHDADAICVLYGHYVRTSPATFEEVEPDVNEVRTRIAAVTGAALPWRVAIDEDGILAGYAYASPYRARSAYRYTVENSVYVAPTHVRRGVASALMCEVIAHCARAGYRQMLAVIGDSGNEASIRLHESLGFEMIGIHRAVGFKFGRWIDVVHMQLALGEGSATAPSDAPAA